MVVKDHTMALDKMQMLMEQRVNDKVSPATNTNWHTMKLTPMQQKTFDRLSKLSGADFDREFMKTMVADHQAAVRDFEMHARSHGNSATTTTPAGKNRRLRTTRKSTMPATPTRLPLPMKHCLR